ncbi:MAG: zinc ribbon domain-containing protein [Eubacterium sp.]|nr:zinc ribbon domain-containing protein [Eubacterium sp.]
MAFCVKCGTEYAEGAKVCSGCGASLENPAPQAAAPAPAPVPAVTPVNTENFFQKVMKTKDSTDTIDPADIQANKAIAILGYCATFLYILLGWFLGSFWGIIVAALALLVPLLMAKNSKWLTFHGFQAITLLITAILAGIFDGAISSFFYNLFAGNSWESALYAAMGGANIPGTIFAWFIHLIFMAIPILIGIAGIINVSAGKAKALPLIGIFKISIDK